MLRLVCELGVTVTHGEVEATVGVGHRVGHGGLLGIAEMKKEKSV